MSNRFLPSRTAFVVTPEISMDGSELYLPGTSNTLYCLQSSSGQILWSTTVESLVLSRPVAFSSSNDASVLYFIESADGRVRQLSTSDSTENWQFNCASASGVSSCQDSVEADFRYVCNLWILICMHHPDIM